MKNISYIFISLLILWSCKEDIFRTEGDDFNVKSFISNIKCFNENAVYNKNSIPANSASAEKPLVSVQSWIIKGKDILMNITVPMDAEEIYFSAVNSKEDYADLHFEGENDDNSKGYYQLQLSNIDHPTTVTNGFVNYLVVLSSNEKTQLNAFDLNVSYKTPEGISDKSIVPMNVINIAPYQKNLKVGFSHLSDYTYSISINTPGSKITYSYNKDTGEETYNNPQSPNSSLSNDGGLGIKWIKLDPVFGRYGLNATIHIDLNDGSQYIELAIIIVAEGKIDQVSADVNIQQTGGNSAIGNIDVGFSYFEEYSFFHVDMTAYRPVPNIDIPGSTSFPNTEVPENLELNPGAGIRVNGQGIAENLVKLKLSVDDISPDQGYEYVLRRTNGSIRVWKDDKFKDLIISNNDEYIVGFSSNTNIFYVENSDGESSFLEFFIRDTQDGTVIASDKILFYPFKSIVIGLGGEGLWGFNNNTPNPGQGIYEIGKNLYELGYDVHLFDEDVIASVSIPSEVTSFIVNANSFGVISEIAIIGYSHGGGSTYDLASQISTLGHLGVATLKFTAYIDAIKQPWINYFSETRLPPGTDYHVNFYQRKDVLNTLNFNGNSVIGSALDCNVTTGINQVDGSSCYFNSALDHGSIDDDLTIINRLTVMLAERVKR